MCPSRRAPAVRVLWSSLVNPNPTRLISAALQRAPLRWPRKDEAGGATTLADSTIGHFVNASPPPHKKVGSVYIFPPEGTIGRHNDGIHAAELRSFTEILLLMSFVLIIS